MSAGTEPDRQDVARGGYLEGWLGRNLRRATNAVTQHFLAEFAQFRIRPALWAMLTAIEANPGASGAQLSLFLDIPRANSVLLLQELEKRGLIARVAAPADGRSHALDLTEAGRDLMPRLHAAHRAHVAYFDAQMTEAERAFLQALLQRLWKTPEQPPG